MTGVNARRHIGLVTGVDEVAQGLILIRMEAPDIAQVSEPGQFVMVSIPGAGAASGVGDAAPADNAFLFLRRPFALHSIRPAQGEVSILFQVTGLGSRALARATVNTQIDMLGPLGQPAARDPNAEHIAFMAGGLGIASLTALMESAVQDGVRVTLLAGARNAWRLYPAHLLPAGIRELTATDDGSAGVRAPVTHLLPQVQADTQQLIACGPTPMLSALAQMRSDGLLTIPTLLLLEARMGCGFGACMGCTVETRDGVRLVCTQGPAFDLDDIRWESPLAPSL